MGDREDVRVTAGHRIAAHTPQMPGCSQAPVVTNHEAKPEGLARAGIRASGRIGPHGSANPYNRCGLTAKAARAGQKLRHLLLSAAESEWAGRDEARRRSAVWQRAIA